MPDEKRTVIELEEEDYRALVHLQLAYDLASLSEAVHLALHFAAATLRTADPASIPGEQGPVRRG
jgi:hypothetical protein